MSAIRRFRQFSLVRLFVAAVSCADDGDDARLLPAIKAVVGCRLRNHLKLYNAGVNHVHQSEAAGSHHQHAAKR